MTMRIMHTMIRVGNLERSIEFYTKVLACGCCGAPIIPAAASPDPDGYKIEFIQRKSA